MNKNQKIVLIVVKRYCEKGIEEIESHKDMPEEEGKVLSVKFKEAAEEIAKAKDVGSFIISNEAVLQLEVLRKGLYSAERADNPYDYYETQLSSIDSCLDSIRKIAKSDLKGE
ncbi:MAG TPA: hypothetical protein VI914_07040 [Thermodesulfobacteriota bacterium]|nr:hypothetical protein [Thermodesulfobacteriota bacterium]